MKKRLLELLVTERLKEGKLLLDKRCFSGAYYLSGYVVECSLKACIAKQINLHEIPDKSFVNEFYVHDLNRLIKLADLEEYRKKEKKDNKDFQENWSIVKDWNESARYKEWTEVEATELYKAIVNQKGGVLP